VTTTTIQTTTTTLPATTTTTASTSSGRIYYVDHTNGDDLNPGTQAAPWKTVARVNGYTFQPGDHILFKRGEVWREFLNPAHAVGSASSWITFGAYGDGAKPKFLGSVDLSSTSKWSLYGDNIWRSLDVTTLKVGQVILNNEALAGFWRDGVSACAAQGDYYWDDANKDLYLYSTSNPGSYYSHIEAATGGISNGQYNRMQSGCVYMVWQDLDIRYSSYHGISVNGSHKKILNCDVSWCGGMVYERRDNNGIFVWASGDDLEIAHNTIHDCYEKAISIQTQTSGSVFNDIYVHHNLMHDTCGGGFEVWLAGAAPCTMTNLRFAHNVMYNVNGSVLYPQRAVPYPSAGSEAIRFRLKYPGSGGGCVSSYVQNNVVHTSSTHYGSVIDSECVAGLTWDYNCYYPLTDGHFFYDGVDNASFARWLTASGQDAHSINADPRFIDPAKGDFRLAAGSPCVGVGAVLGNVGQSTGVAPNMGLY
jgi:hypothetical protein